MATKSESKRNSIRFKVGYDGKLDKPISASLYVFDEQGKFMTSTPLHEGEASLSLTSDQLRRARLFVAPDLLKERGKMPTLQTMAHINAYEPMWKFERGREVYELLPVPEILWPYWYWCACRVRGRAIKVETLGGVTYEKPVCHARVHICEVDRLPWIILQLPDDIIYRLRDELIWAIDHPIPIPNPPDPPYRLDPSYIDPIPVFEKAANVLSKFDGSQVGFNPQPDPPANLKMQAMSRASNVSAAMLNPQPLPPKMATLAFESRAALTTGSIGLVRDALIKHVDLIKIYWCYWDWLWPWFRYDCDELAVIETDAHGRFDTTIYYPCSGDKPDLYFWTEYSIGGTWTTVYHPSIRCNTYWNYVCGTEVIIRMTDPRVHGCGEQPELLGKKVVVKTIGRQVSMGEIYRDSFVPAEKAKEGQVKEGWIDTTKPSPFGATLEPRVDFGNGLKAASITHYRWSYRPLGSINESDWTVMDDILAGRTVSRHYREATGPGDPVVYKSVQIGPDTTVAGSYTIIDPVLPAGGEDWEVLDEGYDLASAYFDTTDLSDGKYELKMELFRKVGAAMVRVDLTADGVELYEITDPAPLVEGSYTTSAATADRVLIDPVTLHVVGYRLVVQVDNRVCFGNIEDVTVNGVPAGHCGFLEYSSLTDTAHISFRASHPANFASFHFRVVRVATDISEASASGLVEAASVNGFTRVGDTFSKNLTIDALMTSGLPVGETPCTRAAFAEALHVYALATNGYDRLTYLDGPRGGPLQVDLKAFAITHV
ncbi:hypothetical protein [Nitrosomonas sp.]|uniref:hypothetical protein n=1 Tax=Nitrosomonas sp. TaxID=42353 RepID=UPI0025EE7983|nr:hypothetical protein [Nitrosomonas sp.]